jgi:deoxyribodipyrimidine photo-lyase
MPRSIVWFRNDLRLEDHEALLAAARRGAVVALFIWNDAGDEGAGRFGAASRVWLHYSLEALKEELSRYEVPLVVRREEPLRCLRQVLLEAEADAVFWNRSYEPALARRDEKIEAALRNDNIAVGAFQGELLFEPDRILTKTGEPYRVFTPFWESCLKQFEPEKPKGIPQKLTGAGCRRVTSLEIEDLELLPPLALKVDFDRFWTPGCAGAKARLDHFLKTGLERYAVLRDFPSEDGVSRLSPYLHFGEMSIRRVWWEVQKRTAREKRPGFQKSAEAYLRQLGWREFAHYLLYHFPFLASRPLDERFAGFSWKKDSLKLHTWQWGLTGYPMVDAGMRELLGTGWMHNRVRMITASFLVKDLLESWQEGLRWFSDTLVDADPANNCFGWQWSAGCGADAAPFFRIFNPVAQGETFDPKGAYVRRWIPELAKLSDEFIHKPWMAPKADLKNAGVFLGDDGYPKPMVDHAKARDAALFFFKKNLKPEK